MTKILEYKARVIELFSEYETYLIPFGKFLLAFVTFNMIQNSLRYNSYLNNLLLLTILSLVCALLPVRAILWLAAFQILADVASLSLVACLVVFVIFVVLFLLYYRFAPKDAMATILTPMAFHFHVPYAMPISCSLLSGPYSVISVLCGTVIYYLLDGISSHSSEIQELEEQGDAGLSEKIKLVLGQVVGNQEMYLVLIIFAVTGILTYLLRRIKADQAWTLAIISGILVQLLGLFIGYMMIHISRRTTWLLLGNILSLLICFLIQFIFMDLDYHRVERVQFEDDDYYYYVKAVPKKMVALEHRTVTHFGESDQEEEKPRRHASAENSREEEPEPKHRRQDPAVHSDRPQNDGSQADLPEVEDLGADGEE